MDLDFYRRGLFRFFGVLVCDDLSLTVGVCRGINRIYGPIIMLKC